MYNLPYFTEDNEELVFDFMQKNSFVNIIGYDGSYPVATHVPVDVKKEEGKIILTGHIMKHTSHHKAFLQNENVLVIFNGPHCYVSASWYVKKDVASTWNYIDVQARGKITFHDTEQTKKIIHQLTDRYEVSGSEAAFNKLPHEYVNRLVKAITGFTIEISSIENVFKLSQNRDVQSRENIIEKLMETDDAGANAIA
ncbi:MAG: FMN-binding negative transcriptional regulator, partial [Ginsengibacter sp.]